MFNLSDILKKDKDEKDKDAQGSNEPVPKEDVVEETKVINTLYEQLLAKVKDIYKTDLNSSSGIDLGLNILLDRITAGLISNHGRKELLRLCLCDYPVVEDYLYYHVLNVTIICLEIGIGSGYENNQLNELGSGALLHDIGIVRHLNIINKPGKLSDEEFKTVKEHPGVGSDLLSNNSKELGLKVFATVRQEHERVDGLGYPLGLKGQDISEYAQIVAVADVYEAMIHNRPYRSKFTPLQAINSILNNKDAFNSKIIKFLIERIGIFPVGFKVRLNTGEIGVVIEENHVLPLRPVVNIIEDSSGKGLKEVKCIDLAGNPVLYIDDCLEYLKKE
jgi:HD-GYP domain-containing protein (c-di-GMP phosphodiesterase class II)